MTQAERLLKTVIEAWGQADLRPALEAFDDNIVWKSASSLRDGKFCFGGEYKGKSDVIALLSTLSTRYFFQRYTAKEIVSKNDIVWGLFDVYGSYSSHDNHEQPRKLIRFETAIRWKVHNGKVLESQTFFDTAALLAQQGELAKAS